ncbi:MAG: hypothetical protein IKE65_04585 [Clostridia bacterium]|nr:hypothetical protein [Clostridia bacterium]
MLNGIAVSGGFAIGKILKLEEETICYNTQAYAGKQSEQHRYETALREFTHKTNAAASDLRRIVSKEEADIFTGHIYMAHDPDMQRMIKEKIASGFNAEMAMESACDSFIDLLSAADSQLIKQRAADVRDIKHSLLCILTARGQKERNIPLGSVIAAREFTPSAVHFMDRRRTVAAVAEQGKRNSHFAILMRAMGIPAVLSVKNLMHTLHDADKVIVDGNSGEVIKI